MYAHYIECNKFIFYHREFQPWAGCVLVIVNKENNNLNLNPKLKKKLIYCWTISKAQLVNNCCNFSKNFQKIQQSSFILTKTELLKFP